MNLSLDGSNGKGKCMRRGKERGEVEVRQSGTEVVGAQKSGTGARYLYCNVEKNVGG